MRIALTGAEGMLGSQVLKIAHQMSFSVLALGHQDLDITHPEKIKSFFESNEFVGLINCAGFTKVDDCENPSIFPQALAINGDGPGYLAEQCQKTNRWLVHFSTDYVFDGQKNGSYVETDTPHPMNAYGRTKLDGELKIQASGAEAFILRTSWLYGANGSHFVRTIAELLKTKKTLSVVTDQVGGPTYTGDLARFALELVLRRAERGLYHFANKGTASWYDFAKEIQTLTGLRDCLIQPVLTKDFPRKAPRPANSCFELTKASRALGREPRPWREALQYFVTKEFA